MSNKPESAFELRKRGEMMVGIGYSMLTGIISILFGRFGYEFFTANNSPAWNADKAYFLWLCLSVALAAWVIWDGFRRISRAGVLESQQVR